MHTPIKNLNIFKRLLYTLQQGFKRPDFYIVFVLMVLILGYIKYSSTISMQGMLSAKTSSDMLGLMVDGITLAAIASIWISDLGNDWKNQLEKYISVSFVHNGETQLEEQYVRLSHAVKW